MLSGQRIETATRRRIGIATAGTGALLLAALLLSALRAAADEGMLFSILFYLAGQSGVCLLLLSVPVLLSARTGSGKPAANNIRV
jgi:hypothetical protein